MEKRWWVHIYPVYKPEGALLWCGVASFAQRNVPKCAGQEFTEWSHSSIINTRSRGKMNGTLVEVNTLMEVMPQWMHAFSLSTNCLVLNVNMLNIIASERQHVVSVIMLTSWRWELAQIQPDRVGCRCLVLFIALLIGFFPAQNYY